MRRTPVAALVVVAVSAVACATPPSGPMVAVDAGSPLPTPGLNWFLSQDGDQVRLAYGIEASDDLRIALDCVVGGGRLDLTSQDPSTTAELLLESGGETERFPVAAEPSELGDGVLLTGQAATASPLFQRFRRVGWLARWRGDVREVYAPQPTSAERIERFFAACG